MKQVDVRGAVAAVMLAVTGVTTIAGSRFAWFGVDHLAFLPGAVRAAWLLACLALLAFLAGGERRGTWGMRVAVLLFLVSLPLGRTPFPTLQGDGDMGGYPLLGGTPDLALYPNENGRLSAFLGRGLDLLLPDRVVLPFHHCGLGQSASANTAWILVTMLVGAALAVLLWISVRRCALPERSRLGLLLLALTAPPMAQAYGHFDSYIVPVGAAVWWGGAAWRCLAEPRRAAAWMHLLASAALGAWAHPLLAVLAPHSVVLWLLASGRLPAGPRATAGWVAGALLFSLWPFVVGAGNVDLGQAASRPILAELVHEKLMSLVQVALPALVLAAASARGPAEAGREGARAFGWWLVVSSGALFLTLWTGYGVLDEFLYGIPGTLVLAGALLLWWAGGAGGRAVAAAAVLSLFLFVPRVAVYRQDAGWQRLYGHLPWDRCAAHRHVSPYRLLAQMLPIETPEFRARRLAVLLEGAERPLPHLAKFEDENRAAYVAWCIAFDETPRALTDLALLLASGSDVLRDLWSLEAPFHTGRYDPTVPWKARALSRGMLEEWARTGQGDDVQRREWDYLNALERDSPNPFRAGAAGDSAAGP